MNILIVEDDELMAQFMKQILISESHYVTVALDGVEGYKKAQKNIYDAIILDILLPNKGGLSICQDLRRMKIMTPVIIVSSQFEEQARITGLDAGADDYMVKPFSHKELKARLRAITRRPSLVVQSTLNVARLELDPDSREVRLNGDLIKLRPKEYELLEFMMRNPNVALTRHLLLSKIWQVAIDSASNRLEVCIRQLRQKINIDGEYPSIDTVRGYGYKLSSK